MNYEKNNLILKHLKEKKKELFIQFHKIRKYMIR